jgi:hypothetical protein
VVEHVPGEVELGEIHVTIDRAQDAGGAQEPVVAAGVHRVEPVAQVLGARDLQHDRGRGFRRHGDGPVVQHDIEPAARDAHVDDRGFDQVRQEFGIGFLDETAEGLRPAEAQDMRTRRIAFRRPEPQGGARINYRRMIWRRALRVSKLMKSTVVSRVRAKIAASC